MPQKFTLRNIKILSRYSYDDIVSCTGAKALIPHYKVTDFLGDYPILNIAVFNDKVILHNTFNFDTRTINLTFPMGVPEVRLSIRIIQSQISHLKLQTNNNENIWKLPRPDRKIQFERINVLSKDLNNAQLDVLKQCGFIEREDFYEFDLDIKSESWVTIKQSREKLFGAA